MPATGEPQLTRQGAEQLVGLGFGANFGQANIAPEIQASARQFRAGNTEISLKILKQDILPFSQKDVQRVLISRLSTERDKDGKKINPINTNENRRLNESLFITEQVRAFVETGTITPRLRTILSGYLIDNSTVFRDAIAHSNDPSSIIDSFLNDPAYKDQLRQIFNDRLDPNKKSTQEDTVRTLKSEISVLEGQLIGEVTQAQLKLAQDAVDQANLKMAGLQAKILELNTKSDQFQELTTMLPSIKTEMLRLQPTVNQLLMKMQGFNTELKSLDPSDQNDANRIQQINVEMTSINNDKNYKAYVQRASIVNSHKELAVEITDLQKDITPAQQELDRAKQDLTDLLARAKMTLTPDKKAEIEAKIRLKKEQLADAEDALEAEMIKFFRDVIHIPQDAAEAYVNTAFTRLKGAWQEEAGKKANKDETDQSRLAQIAVDKLSNLWKLDKTEKGITLKKADRGRSLNFLKDVFKPGGVDNIELKIASITDADFSSLGLSPQEITALRAKWADPEFKRTQSDALAKQAMADYFLTGGRMSKDMVMALATSDWGKTLLDGARIQANNIVTTVKTQINKDVLNTIDELRTHKSIDFVAKHWWKFGIAILLLLIFIGFKSM